METPIMETHIMRLYMRGWRGPERSARCANGGERGWKRLGGSRSAQPQLVTFTLRFSVQTNTPSCTICQAAVYVPAVAGVLMAMVAV
jgi:hypothetical protein